MCLLVVLSRTRPEAPLVVAANRDERYDRPAMAMTVLHGRDPVVLGGRDDLAGGTWLAVNDAGLVAGLTNRPMDGGRDPSKRSRGELPLSLARHRSAAAAVDAFAREVDPSAYNPAWLLAGDRRSLFAIDLADQRTVRVEELAAGIHILENAPPGVDTPKVRRVRSLVAGLSEEPAERLDLRLAAVLSDHLVPDVDPGPSSHDDTALPAVRAACVHTEVYGTRWSCLVTVPATAAEPPEVRYADGPPCTAPFSDASELWSGVDGGPSL